MSTVMDGDSPVSLYTSGGPYSCQWSDRGEEEEKEKDVAAA